MNTMNHHTTVGFTGLLGLLGSLGLLGACDPPTHPRNYTNTIITSLCHFEYDCCTPVERATLLGVSQASTRDGCVEELNDAFGGLMNIAVEAVDRGTAVYDAEAAERCTAEFRVASDQCDAAAFASSSSGGVLSTTSIGFLVASNDAECLALAARGFTRGTVKDGGDCDDSVECADFGDCIVEADDGDLVSAGTCRARLAEGDPCLDVDANCQPGLSCSADGCEVPVLADDGVACTDDAACASGVCAAVADNVCAGSGDVCADDFDCSGSCVADLCVGTGTACTDDFDCDGVCTIALAQCATRTVTVDVCDGL